MSFKRSCTRLDANCNVTQISTSFDFGNEVTVGLYFFYNGFCWKVDSEVDEAQLQVDGVSVYSSCGVCSQINNIEPDKPVPTPTPQVNEKNQRFLQDYQYGVKLLNCGWEEGDPIEKKFYPLNSTEETIFGVPYPEDNQGNVPPLVAPEVYYTSGPDEGEIIRISDIDDNFDAPCSTFGLQSFKSLFFTGGDGGRIKVSLGGGSWDGEISCTIGTNLDEPILVVNTGDLGPTGNYSDGIDGLEFDCPVGLISIFMADSYSDGWNGATLTIEDLGSGQVYNWDGPLPSNQGGPQYPDGFTVNFNATPTQSRVRPEYWWGNTWVVWNFVGPGQEAISQCFKITDVNGNLPLYNSYPGTANSDEMGFGGWNNIPWCKPTYTQFLVLSSEQDFISWYWYEPMEPSPGNYPPLPGVVGGGNFDELPFFILGYNSDNTEKNCPVPGEWQYNSDNCPNIVPPPTPTPTLTPSPTRFPLPEEDYLLIRWRLGCDFLNLNGQIVPQGTIFYSKYFDSTSDVTESDLTTLLPGTVGENNGCRFTRWWGIPVEYLSVTSGNYNNSLIYEQSGLYQYGPLLPSQFAEEVFNTTNDSPYDANAICKGLYSNLFEAGSIDPVAAQGNSSSWLDTRCRFRNIWKSCTSGRLFRITTSPNVLGQTLNDGYITISYFNEDSFGWNNYKLFGRTVVLPANAILQYGEGTQFTQEEINGCFSYYIDEYNLESDNPQTNENLVLDVNLTNFIQFEFINPEAAYDGNQFINNCLTCNPSQTLQCSDIEVSGTRRRMIRVEHCCKCDPATLYGRTGVGGQILVGADGLPMGQQGNCTGKLAENVFATEEQIEEIVQGGGYFSIANFITPDGVSVEEVSGSWRLVTITDVFSFNDYSYRNIGSFYGIGSSCDDAILAVPRDIQHYNNYGGLCIYEYFQGCATGKYYHIFSDIFHEYRGGITNGPTLPDTGIDSYLLDFNDPEKVGWGVRKSGNASQYNSQVNGWLGSGDKRPTWYKVSIPGCGYNIIDGFDKLPQPQGGVIYNAGQDQFFQNYNGFGAGGPRTFIYDPPNVLGDWGMHPDGNGIFWGPVINPTNTTYNPGIWEFQGMPERFFRPDGTYYGGGSVYPRRAKSYLNCNNTEIPLFNIDTACECEWNVIVNKTSPTYNTAGQLLGYSRTSDPTPEENLEPNGFNWVQGDQEFVLDPLGNQVQGWSDYIYLEPGAERDIAGNWKSYKYRTGEIDPLDGGDFGLDKSGSTCIRSIPIHRADLPTEVMGELPYAKPEPANIQLLVDGQLYNLADYAQLGFNFEDWASSSTYYENTTGADSQLSDTSRFRKSCAYGDPTYNGQKIPVIQVGLSFNRFAPIDPIGDAETGNNPGNIGGLFGGEVNVIDCWNKLAPNAGAPYLRRQYDNGAIGSSESIPCCGGYEDYIIREYPDYENLFGNVVEGDIISYPLPAIPALLNEILSTPEWNFWEVDPLCPDTNKKTGKYDVVFGFSSSQNNGEVQIYDGSNTAQAWQGYPNSSVSLRISKTDKFGNDLTSILTDITQQSQGLIQIIIPSTLQEIRISVVEANDLAFGNQIQVLGVITENSISYNSDGSVDENEDYEADLVFQVVYNEQCDTRPFLSYFVNLEACCNGEVPTYDINGVNPGIDCGQGVDLIDLDGEPIRFQLFMNPLAAYGYLYEGGYINATQYFAQTQPFYSSNTSVPGWATQLLQYEFEGWLSNVTVYYQGNCYRVTQGEYAPLDCQGSRCATPIFISAPFPLWSDPWDAFYNNNIDYGENVQLPDLCAGMGLLQMQNSVYGPSVIPLCECLEPGEIKRVLVKFKLCCREIYEDILCTPQGEVEVGDPQPLYDCIPEYWYVNISEQFIQFYNVGSVFLMDYPYDNPNILNALMVFDGYAGPYDPQYSNFFEVPSASNQNPLSHLHINPESPYDVGWPPIYYPPTPPAGFDSVCEYAFSVSSYYGPNNITTINGTNYEIAVEEENGFINCQLVGNSKYRIIQVCCTGEVFYLDITNAQDRQEPF